MKLYLYINFFFLFVYVALLVYVPKSTIVLNARATVNKHSSGNLQAIYRSMELC